VRYGLTPFTTFAVEASRLRDRFVSTPDRDSDSVRVAPSVEFSPRALISGRASIGFQRRKFLTGTTQEFNGTVANVDLTYTLRGSTQFAVGVNRQLEYSYLVGQSDYLVSGFTTSVTHRFGDSWDLGGSFGRSRLSYSQEATPLAQARVFPDETYLSSGGEVGYNIRNARVGFHVEHRQREADVSTPGRGYQRILMGFVVTYKF
jgi:hypothetical protein